MRCPVCAYENAPDTRFCAYCGAELQPEPAVLRPGQLVDDGTYRIIRPLGKGGMGAVYLAANTKAFDRPCVIKEVIEYYDPSDPEEREKAMRRFEAEARTLASLKHPGIPDIYAYFSEQGRNYLVMEYIEGPDLADGLTRRQDGQTVPGSPQPVEDVIQYGTQICQVLDYLEHHEPPVIHNDIKPANIILDQNSGRAVLVDFGTAKTRYTHLGPGVPGAQHSSLYGTIGYAAAELYEGKAEPRSDVYALAATMYHLLTDDDLREHPFKFPRMDAIPDPLRDALTQALSNNVSERPSAAEFEVQLAQALEALRPSGTGAPLSRPVTVRPTHIDLVAASRRELFTSRGAFTVENPGRARADCEITGHPAWLILDPQRFSCPPGGAQEIEMVGRIDLLPPEGVSHRATLQVRIEGDTSRQVEVVARISGEREQRTRLGPLVAIAFATLVLLGALAWFVFWVLPALGP
jgi:serine/threonine protein kinase